MSQGIELGCQPRVANWIVSEEEDIPFRFIAVRMHSKEDEDKGVSA
jgi:hypothetical protein